MLIKKTIDHIRQLDILIQCRNTGTASDLAIKLGLSRTTIFEYLNLMRDLGAPIKFCTTYQTYYYDEEGMFIIEFHQKK